MSSLSPLILSEKGIFLKCLTSRTHFLEVDRPIQRSITTLSFSRQRVSKSFEVSSFVSIPIRTFCFKDYEIYRTSFLYPIKNGDFDTAFLAYDHLSVRQGRVQNLELWRDVLQAAVDDHDHQRVQKILENMVHKYQFIPDASILDIIVKYHLDSSNYKSVNHFHDLLSNHLTQNKAIELEQILTEPQNDENEGKDEWFNKTTPERALENALNHKLSNLRNAVLRHSIKYLDQKETLDLYKSLKSQNVVLESDTLSCLLLEKKLNWLLDSTDPSDKQVLDFISQETDTEKDYFVFLYIKSRDRIPYQQTPVYDLIKQLSLQTKEHHSLQRLFSLVTLRSSSGVSPESLQISYSLPSSLASASFSSNLYTSENSIILSINFLPIDKLISVLPLLIDSSNDSSINNKNSSLSLAFITLLDYIVSHRQKELKKPQIHTILRLLLLNNQFDVVQATYKKLNDNLISYDHTTREFYNYKRDPLNVGPGFRGARPPQELYSSHRKKILKKKKSKIIKRSPLRGSSTIISPQHFSDLIYDLIGREDRSSAEWFIEEMLSSGLTVPSDIKNAMRDLDSKMSPKNQRSQEKTE